MPDMLVRLYALPSVKQNERQLAQEGIVFREALPSEKRVLSNWVKDNFSLYWAGECETAFFRKPVACWIALNGQELLGFACYEVTAKAFFGPAGVLESHRGMGIGKVLLVKALESLHALGYAYGIIGGVGPARFYEKTVGATLIQDSTPGVYAGLLKV